MVQSGSESPALNLVEINVADGIVVTGRIDLIRRADTGEVIIVDFKADDWVQDEIISMEQLNLYALGYQQLTGKAADIIELYNLKNGSRTQDFIDEMLLASTLEKVQDACHLLRDGCLCRTGNCGSCDFKGICPGSEQMLL
jgi:DNA helicase II / ATP-dependent DNA helicase PcrA